MAGFSVFGTFTHLVMVNYGAPKGTRAAQAAILTFLGAILVTLGTLVSVSTWLAVAGAVLVAIVGANQACYWIILPCIILFSAYASSALGFIAGQAGFTVFAVGLFCIVSPVQRQVGLLRVEDVAIGGIVSLLVASLQRFGKTNAPQPLCPPQ